MANTNVEIITVKIGHRCVHGKGVIFEVDSTVLVKGGLDDPMQQAVRECLRPHIENGELPKDEATDAIRRYNEKAKQNDDSVGNGDAKAWSELSFFKRFWRWFGGGGGGSKVSPFDISLDGKNTNANGEQGPFLLLYISETQNWSFRGNYMKNLEIVEIAPFKNSGAKYPPGKGPNDMLGARPKTAHKDDRERLCTLFVKNPVFGKHPEGNPAFNGFVCNINMAVKQDPDHETLIVIDPKIRNP